MENPLIKPEPKYNVTLTMMTIYKTILLLVNVLAFSFAFAMVFLLSFAIASSGSYLKLSPLDLAILIGICVKIIVFNYIKSVSGIRAVFKDSLPCLRVHFITSIIETTASVLIAAGSTRLAVRIPPLIFLPTFLAMLNFIYTCMVHKLIEHSIKSGIGNGEW